MNVLKIVGPLALVITTMTGTVASAADRRVESAEMNVHPRMALAGTGGRILVRVPIDADNRRLRVEIGSRSLVAAGEVALDGLGAREAYWFNLPALPAGFYYIKATVYGSSGPRSRTESQISRR